MSMADRIAVMAEGRVQQIAGPLDLYRRPANLFVADFIGTSNLLPGRVEGGAFVSDEIGVLPTAGATAATGAGHLVVRPEDVRIVQGADAAGPVFGEVVDVQFKGGSSAVAVTVAGLPRPFLASVPGATSLDRGQRVALNWTTAVVVADELA